MAGLTGKEDVFPIFFDPFAQSKFSVAIRWRHINMINAVVQSQFYELVCFFLRRLSNEDGSSECDNCASLSSSPESSVLQFRSSLRSKRFGIN